MIDYQRTIEFLRDYRAVPGQPVTDEVRRCATDYAQICVQANERLRQCSVFLQQSLRSEAIHLANETPPLLDLVAALDLPDSAAWSEFCAQNDLPAPPPLQVERAVQLNEAYGQEQPLETLLRRHRRLALCHAPVKHRLQTMREIHAIDPSSAFMEKDLREFEAARLKELRIAFATALEHRDSQTISVLSAEVLQTPWLETVGDDILAAARGAEEHLRLVTLDATVRALMGNLRNAYAARDHAECSSLLAQLRKTLADGKQPGVSSQTASELQPIIAWISREDELLAKREAVAQAQKQLSDAMDADLPETQIEVLHRKLLEMGETIPEPLEQRYQQRLQTRLRAAVRRNRLILAGLAAVVLILFGVGYWQIRVSSAAGWAQTIHQANANRDLPRARQLIAEQERRAPGFSEEPAVATAKEETAVLQRQYDQDRQAAQALVTTLEQRTQSADADLKQADTTSATGLAAAAGRVDQALQQAKSAGNLAWADTDGQLATATKAAQTRSTRLHEAADQKAIALAGTLSQKLDGVGADAQSLDALEALGAEVANLQKALGLGKDASAAVTALATKLYDKRAAFSRGLDEAQQLAAMRRRATSVDAWKKELDSFTSRFPDSPLTADFTRAAVSLKAATAVDALHKIVDGWSGQFTVDSEAQARDRIQQLKSYLANYPESPYRSAIDQYCKYLGKAADALAVKSSWLADFKELIATPMLAELRYLATSDGTRYYILGNPKLKMHNINESAIVTFEAVDPANLTKRKAITIAPPLTLTTEKPVPVPHAKFVESLATQLKQITPDNWDTFGIQLIGQIAQDNQMDPIVQAVLLQQAMRTTNQICGWGLNGIYDEPLRELARLDVESIIWYDPAKPVPPATIQAIRRIIDTLPTADVAVQTLRQSRDRLFASLNCSNLTTTGALLRDDHSAWAIYPGGAAGAVEDASIAWAVGPASLVRIGRFANGKFIVDDAALRDLPQGTLVFIGK